MKVLSSASARPNFVKLAAVHRALQGRDSIDHVIVHTGQHYDPLLSDIFFSELAIPAPVANLGIKGGGDRDAVIAATTEAFIPLLQSEKPDLVLVYGDVNGSVGAARAAKRAGIRLGHIEAGLRSGDLSMPEERNRIEIDAIADDLFVTEESGMRHLRDEGIRGTAHLVGNTMIDTLIRMRSAIDAVVLPRSFPERFAIATVHRPSNVDDPLALKEILRFLAEVSDHIPLAVPLHHRTYGAIEKHHLWPLMKGKKDLWTLSPLGYLEFLHMLSLSTFVLTDSGGIQEEAAFLRKRCFTLRHNTERPATIASGSNVLVDHLDAHHRAAVLQFALHPDRLSINDIPLWDGHAGERIADLLLPSSR